MHMYSRLAEEAAAASISFLNVQPIVQSTSRPAQLGRPPVLNVAADREHVRARLAASELLTGDLGHLVVLVQGLVSHLEGQGAPADGTRAGLNACLLPERNHGGCREGISLQGHRRDEAHGKDQLHRLLVWTTGLFFR
jgi:hypothetical protein